MPPPPHSEHPWRDTLAAFLRENREVAALRINFENQAVSFATLGEADSRALEEKLLATIRSITRGSPATPPESSDWEGLEIRESADTLELAKPTCTTAGRLRRWQTASWEQGTTETQGTSKQYPEEEEEDWRLLASLAAGCAVFGLAGWISSSLGAPVWVVITCHTLAMLCGGWDALHDSLENLPKGKLDIHFLMLAVAVGAASIGAWAEGSLLLFLFSASGALEAFAMHRTRQAIDSLFKDQPKTAAVLDDAGKENAIPVEQVQPGQTVLIRPGDIFPLDGEVIEGETAADESSMTGEALPVTKAIGDDTFGGTLNLWGSVKIRVLRPAGESALQKIIHLIQNAQRQKAPSQRFTDRFGTGYTLLILGSTTAMFLVWWLFCGLPPLLNTPEEKSAFYRAMTLLVVASPCALVLSIPSAILAAIAWSARRGILFRGGAALEKLADIDCVAMDKTGTLTTGDLVVDRVESFPPGAEETLLRHAVALESRATHPLARAIVAHGKRQGITPDAEVLDFYNMTGQGVRGEVNGVSCILGRRELITRGPLAKWADQLPPLPTEHSEVWVLEEKHIGRILLRDQVRTESQPVLAALREMGLRTIMLTGDRSTAAQSVGDTIGIQDIRSGLTPEGKVAAIRQLADAGHHVAMVGDGVNDAPCLAAAHVSIGMGARGSDAALEQCDIVLMNDRIEGFLEALRLGVRARAVIKQNLAISLGTILVMVCASIGFGIPLYLGVFAHEGSTVLVCLNSLRLLFGGRTRD